MTITKVTRDIPDWYVCSGKIGKRIATGAGRTPIEALKDALREHEKYGAKNV